MSAFISDKDTAKLYVQFFWIKITPKSKSNRCKNELICIRGFEAVKKTHSVLSEP